MVFSDTTNKNGIIQECERITGLGDEGISGVTRVLQEFTSNVNEKNREVLSWIQQSSYSWQYDDQNQTDLPVSTAELRSGRQKYQLDSEMLTVRNIKIKDKGGNYVELNRTNELPTKESGSGVPSSFVLMGRTIIFDKTPDYTQADGIRVQHDRDVVEFTTSDTTATPGFAPHLHRGLAIGASYIWLQIHRPGAADTREQQQAWQDFEQRVRDFYQFQDIDNPPKIDTVYHSFA